MDKRHLTWMDVEEAAAPIAVEIGRLQDKIDREPLIYGVPRGGIYAAMLVRRIGHGGQLTTDPSKADVFVDDIIDTGTTAARYISQYPGRSFHALIIREQEDPWFIFPWEVMTGETGPTENVVRMLEYIGEDPKREGLLETPSRVIKSYEKLFGGYRENPADQFKTFKEGACDEMIVLRNIEFFSHCEHHIMPFFGQAHIGYIPAGKVIGISKLARLLEVFARRLQIQERIGEQVTAALMEHLKPRGCACMLEAQHFCMTSRGVEKQNSVMVTSSMKGNFLDREVRQEFLSIVVRR